MSVPLLPPPSLQFGDLVEILIPRTGANNTIWFESSGRRGLISELPNSMHCRPGFYEVVFPESDLSKPLNIYATACLKRIQRGPGYESLTSRRFNLGDTVAYDASLNFLLYRTARGNLINAEGLVIGLPGWKSAQPDSYAVKFPQRSKATLLLPRYLRLVRAATPGFAPLKGPSR